MGWERRGAAREMKIECEMTLDRSCSLTVPFAHPNGFGSLLIAMSLLVVAPRACFMREIISGELFKNQVSQ
jgi:hypothetical protein